MGHFMLRIVRLIFGLFLCSVGLIISINANIGLAPWEAFSIGISKVTGISYGNVVILTGLVILIADYLLKEKIGVGTILNTVLIGIMADMILKMNVIPVLENFILGIFMLLLGQIISCYGCYLYIREGMGSGPRDSLMVAFGKRFRKIPIGIVRGVIEGTVLLIGWMLGAKVGLGTVISVFGISFILQTIFHIAHFDVKNVEHESVVDTARNLAASQTGC